MALAFVLNPPRRSRRAGTTWGDLVKKSRGTKKKKAARSKLAKKPARSRRATAKRRNPMAKRRTRKSTRRLTKGRRRKARIKGARKVRTTLYKKKGKLYATTKRSKYRGKTINRPKRRRSTKRKSYRRAGSKRRSYRRNPAGAVSMRSAVNSMKEVFNAKLLVDALWGAGGAWGTLMLPDIVLPRVGMANRGFVGYAANLASAGLSGFLVRLVTKDARRARIAVLGGVIATVVRAGSDLAPRFMPLSISASPLAGLGNRDYELVRAIESNVDDTYMGAYQTGLEDYQTGLEDGPAREEVLDIGVGEPLLEMHHLGDGLEPEELEPVAE
jgi:hypothetical protein